MAPVNVYFKISFFLLVTCSLLPATSHARAILGSYYSSSGSEDLPVEHREAKGLVSPLIDPKDEQCEEEEKERGEGKFASKENCELKRENEATQFELASASRRRRYEESLSQMVNHVGGVDYLLKLNQSE